MPFSDKTIKETKELAVEEDEASNEEPIVEVVEQETIPFSNFVLALSNIEDFFFLLPFLKPDKESLLKVTELQEIRSELKKIILEETAAYLLKNFNEIALTLSKYGLGTALQVLAQYNFKVNRQKEKFLENTNAENSIFGHHVFQVLFADNKNHFEKDLRKAYSAIPKLKETFSEKTLEKQTRAFDIFTTLSLANHTIPVNSVLEKSKGVLKGILLQFELKDLFCAHESFKELLGLDHQLKILEFEEGEIAFFVHTLMSYMEETGEQISPHLNGMIAYLKDIKPFLKDFESDFLDNRDSFPSKASFIVNSFAKNPQFHTTFYGMAMVASVYLELEPFFPKMISHLYDTLNNNNNNRGHKKKLGSSKPQPVLEIEKYQRRVETFFQLSARYVMPIEEFTKYCTKMTKLLDNLEGKSSTLTAYNDNLYKKITELEQTKLIISLKTHSQNSLIDIRGYINKIKEYLASPENFSLLSFFNKDPESDCGKKALIEISHYLTNLQGTHSRVQQSIKNDIVSPEKTQTIELTNFQAIQKELAEILNRNKIDPGKKYANKYSMLAIEIFKRFESNAKRQSDIPNSMEIRRGAQI